LNIINELDAAIVMKAKKSWWEHHPKTAHSVTDFSFEEDGKYFGSCLRKQYYDWKEVEPLWETINPTRCYAREFGSYVQKFVEDLLALRGFLIQKEVKLPPIKIEGLTKPLHGRLDDILSRADTMDRTMVEIKSCHGRKFNSKQFGIMYHGPTRENVYQLGMYKKYFPETIQNHHLIYFSREDFNRRDFVDTENMWVPTEFDFKYWVMLEDYLANKVLPKRTYRANADKGRSAFPCSWCDYDSVCWEIHRELEGE